MDISSIKCNVLDYVTMNRVNTSNQDVVKNILEGFVCLASHNLSQNKDCQIEFKDKENFKEFEIKSQKTNYYKNFQIDNSKSNYDISIKEQYDQFI